VNHCNSYTLKDLPDGKYYWSVQAIDNCFSGSPWATEQSFTIIANSPTAPQHLTSISSNQQVSLHWNKNTELDFLRYRIYSGTTANPTTKIDSTTGGILDTTKVITNLTNGTTYYFRITAVDSSGNESDFSNEVNATPTGPILGEYTADNNTVLLLHMNETSGNTVNDVSQNRYTGSFKSGSFVPGRLGNAFQPADSCGIVLQSFSTIDLSTQFTIEAWLKLYSYPTNRIGIFILGDNSSINCWISSNLNIVIDLFSPNGYECFITSQPMISLGIWYHLAVTFGNGLLSIYINGDLKEQYICYPSVQKRVSRSQIIGSVYCEEMYPGVIDEARISKIVRDPGEFNLQLPPKNLQATVNPSTISLNWQNGGGTVPLMRYKIYRGIDSVNVSLIDSTINTAFNDNKITLGAPYFYRVSAVDSTGFEGVKSKAVRAATPLPGEYKVDANTMLLWHLNEIGGGVAYDEINNSNNGTFNSTTIVNGKFGKAKIPAIPTTGNGYEIKQFTLINFAQTDFTLEAWVRTPTPPPGGQYWLFGTSSTFTVIIPHWGNINGKLLVRIQDAGGTQLEFNSNKYVDDLKWHHIALERIVNKLSILIDGVVDSTIDISNLGEFTNDYNFSGGGDFTIDEVRLSNIAHTPQEFNLQLPPKNLTATPSSNFIQLSWQNGGGAIPLMRYRVYRKTASTYFTLIDSTIQPLYQDINLVPGTLYYYQITAVDSTGFGGAPSDVVSAGYYAQKLNISPTLSGEQSGNIQIQYQVTNFPNTVGLKGEYQCSLDDSWHLAHITGDTSQIAPANFSGSLVWNSATDLNGVDLPAVNFRLTCYSYSTTLSEMDTLTFHLDNNQLPSIAINTLSGEQKNAIPITYNLSDAEHDTLSLTCEYLDPTTLNWQSATITGLTTGITNYSDQQIIWQSLADLPTTMANILFRISPSDNDPGVSDTVNFLLDNVGAPTVAITNQFTGELSGDVSIQFQINDDESDVVSLTPQYSLNSGTNWSSATVTGKTTGLTQSEYTGSLIWHSNQDAPGIDLTTIRLRLIPADAHTGLVYETADFHLDNNQPPKIQINLAYQEVSGNVGIPYLIIDTENDSIQLDLFYSRNQSNWSKGLTADNLKIGSSLFSDTLFWNSETDLPRQDISELWLRIDCRDNDSGTGDTVKIHLDNETGPKVISHQPAGEENSFALWNTPIVINFNRDLDTNSITSQLLISGQVAGNVEAKTHFETPRKLTILPTGDLTAYDTVTVTIKSGLTDLYGIHFDGNGNGDPDAAPDDDYTFTFLTTLLGDYNQDVQISIEDFYTLRTAWLAKPPDYSKELGPVTGSLPHYHLNADHKFDLWDLMALATSWNWWFDNLAPGSISKILAKNTNNEAPFTLTTNYEKYGIWAVRPSSQLTLEFDLTKQLKLLGFELYIQYDPKILSADKFKSLFASFESAGWVVFDRVNADQGFAGMIIFKIGEKDMPLDLTMHLGRLTLTPQVENEASIKYWLKLASWDGDSINTYEKQAEYTFATKQPIPKQYALHPNFPNPFNPITKIRYELPKESDVRLAIFNLRGELIKWIVNDKQQPGYYECQWDGTNNFGQAVSSGIYLYRLQAGDFQQVRKCLIVK